MKTLKNNLDERQEQALLNIEKIGCWAAYFALLLSIFVQMAIYGVNDFKAVAGEWIIFMLLSVYLLIACMKNGIWDRRLKPNRKTNLIVSAVSAVIFSLLFAIVNYVNYKALIPAVMTFFIGIVIIFVLVYVALSVCSKVFKKRESKLDAEYEDDFDEQ